MWACVRDTYEGENRAVFCFDFKELVANTILMSPEEKARFTVTWMTKSGSTMT